MCSAQAAERSQAWQTLPGPIASHLSATWRTTGHPGFHVPPAAVPSPPMRHPSSSSYSGSLSPLLRPRELEGQFNLGHICWEMAMPLPPYKVGGGGPGTQVHNTTQEVPHTRYTRALNPSLKGACKWVEMPWPVGIQSWPWSHSSSFQPVVQSKVWVKFTLAQTCFNGIWKSSQYTS